MTIGMDTFEDAPDAAGGEDVQDAAFVPAYPNAGEWVTGWLLPHYRRNPAVFRWDPRWWQYEASRVSCRSYVGASSRLRAA